MENTFWNVFLSYPIGLVIGVGVQSLIGNNVVQKKTSEVFFPATAEQKRIGLITQPLERKVRRREEGASNVFRGIVEDIDQTCLCQAKLEGAKFARKEADDVHCVWGRD